MRIRFSLLTLIVMTTLISGPLVLIGGHFRQNRFEAQLAESLDERFSGMVRVKHYDDGWLPRIRLEDICITSKEFGDHDLRQVCQLSELNSLRLSRPAISDSALESLSRLDQLTMLGLAGAKISDRGLIHIGGLQSLEALNLYGTKVTDAGIEHLVGLENLKSLNLRNTETTRHGIERLKSQLPACKIKR